MLYIITIVRRLRETAIEYPSVHVMLLLLSLSQTVCEKLHIRSVWYTDFLV